jgi:4-amino-4-deoxy-L-arabinose transferase-like glycosyltransferase
LLDRMSAFSTAPSDPPVRRWLWPAGLVLLLALHGHFATVGWKHGWLAGHEFRQTQTALSALFIDRDNNFSPAYPTPLFGKPWSIPMEFPLYEWAVVGLTRATGLSLTEAGRSVSLACFYLSLPALHLLLGALGVGRAGRWLAVGLVLCAPLYVFYSRAFMIESMALAFALWFVLGLLRFTASGRAGWAALAVGAGVLAGLAKVTTFASYGLAGAVWCAWQWSRPADRRVVSRAALVARALGAVALPLIIAIAWVRYSDHLKSLNPGADFLRSGPMEQFNFGSLALRFSGSYWQALPAHWGTMLLPVPLTAVVLFGALATGAARRGLVLASLGLFVAVQLVFANLYYLHDYYLYAIGVLPLAALAVAYDGVLVREGRRLLRIALVAVTVVAITGLQWRTYARNLLPSQQLAIPGGGEHTTAVRAITAADDVVVIVGRDWSSEIPYYSQRRALMVPEWREGDSAYLARAFAALRPDRVGVFAISTKSRHTDQLLRLAEHELGIVPVPVFTFRRDLVFYFHEALQDRVDAYFQGLGGKLHELTLDAAPVVPSPFRLREFVVPNLTDASPFASISPTPVRFRTALDQPQSLMVDGTGRLNAHAPSELEFALHPGPHHLQAQFGLPEQTYGHPTGPNTDGVRFVAVIRRPRHAEILLAEAWLDPNAHPADRGTHRFDLDFTLPAGATLVLITGPGPANNNAYDWSYWGPVQVQ